MSKRKTPTFSSIIAQRRELARSLRSENAVIEANQDGITATLAVLAPVFRACDSHYVNVTSYGDDVWMDVTARLDVETLKGVRVADMLERCEALPGFASRDSTDYCSEHTAQRTYKYKATFGNVRTTLRIEANLPVEGDACRRVQVGTEIREVPVYALECAE